MGSLFARSFEGPATFSISPRQSWPAPADRINKWLADGAAAIVWARREQVALARRPLARDEPLD